MRHSWLVPVPSPALDALAPGEPAFSVAYFLLGLVGKELVRCSSEQEQEATQGCKYFLDTVHCAQCGTMFTGIEVIGYDCDPFHGAGIQGLGVIEDAFPDDLVEVIRRREVNRFRHRRAFRVRLQGYRSGEAVGLPPGL